MSRYTTQDIVTLSEATARNARTLVLAADALQRAEVAVREARKAFDESRRILKDALESWGAAKEAV